MSAFDRLIEQIDAFIRKYYKSEILKGVLIVIGFLLASWLTVSVLEYFGRFPSSVRLVLLILFLGMNGYLLVRYFVLPIMRLYSFGKRINRTQAARIIGSFFPNVSDRLLNTLQLNEHVNENDRSFELIRASVSQKSNELLTVKFEEAVRYEESKKYLKYVIPVILLFASVAIFTPGWIMKGSSNVVNFSTAQEAPFEFHLVNKVDRLREGSSYNVEVDITGLYVPEHVFLVSSRGRYKMTKIRKNRMEFPVDNLKSDLLFHFESEGFESKEFQVKVLGNSSLGKVIATVHYPKYLNKKDERLLNIADLDIPEGTKVDWDVEARNVRWFKVLSKDVTKQFDTDKGNFQSVYKEDGLIHFILKNKDLEVLDTSRIQVHVIKDAFPSILVSENIDSIRTSVRLFEGLISDDYGLTSLYFVYTIHKKSGAELKRRILVDKYAGTNSKFSFAVDFSRDNIAVEDKIGYHFQVFDNDGVNGSKSTSSQNFVYELPTLTNLNEKRDEVQKELKNALTDVFKKTEQFQKDVNKLQKSLMNKSKSDFKNMEQVQSLKQQQQTLQEELQAIKDKLDASNDEKNKLSEQDEELLKQQELIEELLKEVMDDELKKLLDELEKLMEKNDRQEMKNETDKLDASSDEMKKQLDRTMEMLKRLQVNEKIDDLEKELDQLAEQQEKLEKDLKDEKLSEKEASKKQEELNKKFDDLKKDMQEMQKLNEELERPMPMDSFEQEQQEISNEMNEAKSKLDQGKKSKAGESQKSAAKKMKELSDQLNNQQESANKKQNEEDMGLIRLLLENLMSLSFDQEYVMNRFGKVKDMDPYYNKLGRKQRSIIDDNKLIEDSLMALAKRQTKIAPFIDKEVKEIRTNFGLITDEIGEHSRKPLQQHQQYVMTSYNNLALMLNESLQAMQQQAQSEKPGSGSCDNPGGSGKKPSGGQMSSGDMKEMLKKQLEQMKKGPNPGGKQPGDKPGQMPGQSGQQGMPGLGNKEIAKMAAQQTAIRQRLEQLRNEMNKDGKGNGNQLNPLIKELEQQEKDLINKQFSPDMIRRQQDILTRLLESEKALKERGFEEKRESTSGKNTDYGNLIRFDEYKRNKLGQIELLRAVDPLLTKYYKDKASKYFNQF
jgi:hypothetical protein